MKENKDELDFDIYFDFRTDSGGVDPDKGSPTLRRYHRLLWSKKLPNGEMMQLTHDNGGYLKWKDFEFGSDAMINGLFYTRAKNSVPELKRMLCDYDAFVEGFEHQSWTIGGEIIFPQHANSMNQLRGTNAYVMDRWDLTLECIRRFYLDEDSPLYEVLDRDRAFYELFVDFKGYVDFFFLQDCISLDYESVIFWQDDHSLTKTMPLPKTAGEHIVWTEKGLQFIRKRAERMRRSLEKDLMNKSVRACFGPEDIDYHPVENTDGYCEILDEVVNLLRRDDSLDVSTKGLRATRYANGYARYLRINGCGCGVLFDKENWKDPESLTTPFWLNINDSGWNQSDRLKSWMGTQDDQKVAWKWQRKPCLALVPPVNTTYHQVCDNLANQIIDVIRDLRLFQYIDFNNVTSLAYKKPLWFSLHGYRRNVSKWRDMFVDICKKLCEMNPDFFSVKASYGQQFNEHEWVQYTERAYLMKVPVSISNEFVIETNYDSNTIINRIKEALDGCNINYNDVVICYERNPKERNADANKRLIYVREDEKGFYEWMANTNSMSDSTIKSYFTYLHNIERYLEKHDMLSTSLYDLEPDEFDKLTYALLSNPEYLKENERKSHLIKAAVNKLGSYLRFYACVVEDDT